LLLMAMAEKEVSRTGVLSTSSEKQQHQAAARSTLNPNPKRL